MKQKTVKEIINLKDMERYAFEYAIIEYIKQESCMYHHISKTGRYISERKDALEKFNLLQKMYHFITTGETGCSITLEE